MRILNPEYNKAFYLEKELFKLLKKMKKAILRLVALRPLFWWWNKKSRNTSGFYRERTL